MFKENSDMELKTVCKLLGLREFLRMRENRKDTDFFLIVRLQNNLTLGGNPEQVS